MVSRPDRRDDNSQLRAFSASQNILNRADGSSKFEFGKVNLLTFTTHSHTTRFLYSFIKTIGSTSVICSVSGPIDVQIRDEKLDEATVEVVVRPFKGVPTTKEKLMESILRSTFEPVILGGMMPCTNCCSNYKRRWLCFSCFSQRNYNCIVGCWYTHETYGCCYHCHD
jgi:exosome complex component RRP46